VPQLLWLFVSRVKVDMIKSAETIMMAGVNERNAVEKV
jgi:hypothetical protein